MSEKFVWTDGQDTQIRRLRTEGASCEIIALEHAAARPGWSAGSITNW